MNSLQWINKNTQGSKCVVEFGAAYCEKLRHCHSSVDTRIGLEIWEDYLEKSTYDDCIKICCDFTEFEDHLSDDDMDTALFYDTLEHLRRKEAFCLIKAIQDKFNKILLMIPIGHHPQEVNENPWQDHLSEWNEADVKELGFQEIVLIPNYHNIPGKDHGCVFAIWRKGA